MKILVACEESQTVTIELRKLGHEAYSCDIIECSGGHPEWHIMQDVLPMLNGNCEFKTLDGVKHKIDGKWDMIIAFPPCTYLTVTGNRWFNIERYGEKTIQRMKDREDAIKFMDSLRMICIVTHVADARTCVLHPASHTHRQLSDEQLIEAGVAPDLIRLSVGIEDVEDILADIRQALDKV